MRRLLGEVAAPPPRPRPPPVVIAQPPQVPQVPPVVVRPVIVPRRPAPSMPSPRSVPSAVEVSAGQMAPMKESRQAYERASQLDVKVAEHIDRVPGQHVLATVVTRRPIAPEITQVIALFKNARATRQAVVAAAILGPPKSLDETPGVSW